MASVKKEEIITFKVDERLSRELARIPNRSEFIRRAILSSLDNLCPLCGGTGVLSADQGEHWRDFARSHQVVECETCHAYHLVCSSQPHSG